MQQSAQDNNAETMPNPEVAEIDAAIMQSTTGSADETPKRQTDTEIESSDQHVGIDNEALNGGEASEYSDFAQETSADDFSSKPQPVDGLVSQIGLKKADQEEEGVDEDLTPVLSWQASEPSQIGSRSMPAMPIVLTAAALISAGIFVVGGINFGSIFSVITIIFGVFTLFYVNNQQQQLQEYTIYEKGVAVGSQFYGYSDLKSFNVVSDDDSSLVIELEPVRRFMVRTVIHPDGSNAEQVIDTLSRYLPRQDKEPSTIDKFSSSLRS